MSRKPGRKPVFTEQDVIEAAFAIGINQFTLSQVAERLGVAAAALYRLFESRDAIVHACVRHAVTNTTGPEHGLEWRELLYSLADTYWRLCEDYPGLDKVMINDPAAVSHFADFFQRWSEPLLAAGKTTAQAMFACDMIGYVTMMAHANFRMYRRERPGTGSPAGEPEQFASPMQVLANRGMFETQINFILNALEREWPGAVSS